jgi:hypothetical protein
MKKTILLISLVFVVALIIFTGCEGSDADQTTVTAPGTKEEGVTAACSANEVIMDGIYKYENNTWGVTSSTDYEQCLITKEVDGETKRGWTWNFYGQAPNFVFSYPEIIVGWKPWGSSTSTDENYPVKVSDVESLTITYDVDIDASGGYNLAPEIWLISSKPKTTPMESPETLITTEIMFWMDYSSGIQPAGSLVGTFEFDGKNYNLWIKTDHNNSGDSVSWAVYSLVSQKKQLKGEIDVIGLIQALIDKGYGISNEEYIATVEFGNETFGPDTLSHAEGTTWINSYSVELTVK